MTNKPKSITAWCVKHSNGVINFLSVAKEPEQAVDRHLERRGIGETLEDFNKSEAYVVRVKIEEIET